MRRKDKEIKDIAEIEAIIKKAELCHMAVADENGPYAFVVNHGFADGALYFHSATAGRKIEALKKNGRVSFCVYTDYSLVTGEMACNCTAAYKSVMGVGKAEIIAEPEAKKKGLEIILKHHGIGLKDFNENILTVTAVVKVTIESMTGKKSKT